MRCWLTRVATVLLLCCGMPGQAAGVEPADLEYMGRTIYTMRAPVAGATPQRRAERALDRLRAVAPEQRAEPVRIEEVMRDGERALALKNGDETLLTVFARDLDPDTGATLDEVGAQAREQLQAAFQARIEMGRPEVIGRGLASTLAGVVVLVLGLWGMERLRGAVNRRLRAVVRREARSHRVLGIDWTGFGLRAVSAASWGVAAAGDLSLAYVCLAHALRQFPATLPLAHDMREWLLRGLGHVATALWSIVPNLATILFIVLVARGVVAALNAVFGGVIAGTFRVPGIHPETAGATRSLAVLAVWGLALAAAYPYIPGSSSDVFRGLSVFLGFVFTLGSTGVVSQWMQGLVIVYSRALRAGDFVRIGEVEGVVRQLGALSVKVINHRKDEVTVPNSTVVAGPVTNYSRLVPDGGAHGSVAVTIGYDVPWRQVNELLLQAAGRTPQVRRDPPPQVLQRALSDFYVAYELNVAFEQAGARASGLSTLHGHVRDVFEAAGVAILSPHVMEQIQIMPRPPAG